MKRKMLALLAALGMAIGLGMTSAYAAPSEGLGEEVVDLVCEMLNYDCDYD